MGKVRLMKEIIHFYHPGSGCIRVLLSNSSSAVCKSPGVPQLKKNRGEWRQSGGEKKGKANPPP